MIYLITTDTGLEAVAEGELREADPAAGITREPYGLAGHLRVETDRVDPILGLSTIHHVIEVRREQPARTLEETRRIVQSASFPELGHAASFRVTSRRSDGQSPDRIEIERAAGAVLQQRYGTAVDLERFEVQIRVDRCGEQLVCGIQLTRESLGNRIRRSEPLRSALKPTVAAAMVRMVSAHRGPGRLIDPMCGAATIPIEARRSNPGLEISAADWDEPTVEVARRSIAEQGLEIPVARADARALGAEQPGRFDYIVTDPPYGVRQARRTSLIRLYEALLPSFERALGPEGRIALVVLKYRTFLKALERTDLSVVRENTVDLGGLSPRIVILARHARS